MVAQNSCWLGFFTAHQELQEPNQPDQQKKKSGSLSFILKQSRNGSKKTNPSRTRSTNIRRRKTHFKSLSFTLNNSFNHSLSLSLSTILPTPHFLLPPKPITTTTSSILPNKVKIPSQISLLSTLSLFSSFSPSKQTHFTKSTTISPTPLQNPRIHNPKRSSDPSNGAALRRSSIVWFRNDLRVHDNEVLNSANKESMSVLPVFCFDPRDYGKSSSGFDKTGPYRANFLIESVSDLRKSLQSRGSDLVVRIGNPENVLVELAKAIGADAVYAHGEVAHDEVKAEEKIENAHREVAGLYQFSALVD